MIETYSERIKKKMMEDNKINYTIDIDYKTFRKGNHKYLELNDFISGLTVQYHLAIQKKIISALSDYQLKRLLKLCTYELQQRRKKNEEK